MDPSSIGQALDRAQEALDGGMGLSGTGFWRAVAAVKADPVLVDRYAERIARIDQEAFSSWPLVKVPLRVGTSLMVVATLVGLVLIGAAYYTSGFAAAFYIGAGTGVLLVTTHGLGHLVVGRLVGIGFTGWFIGSISQPQPGVKVDYSSYLRTPARGRAWMHASGAIVTKSIPFLMVGASLASGAPTWVAWVLAAVGTATIVTDVLWSTSSSDWMKFKREMAFSQRSE